jgi:autotransporter-associated beta strand protein
MLSPVNLNHKLATIKTMKSRLLSVLLACACANLARADFNPVALTPGSYTYGIVVPASTPAPLPYCINVTAGNGVGLGDNTYYEQGLYAAPGETGSNSGIPVHNTVFTNINNANMTFLMPPSYTVNNELMVDSTFTSGTLTFGTATTTTNLAILCTGGGGPLTVNYTITHSDNSTETGVLSLLDWFTGGSTAAWGANGRISSGGGYDHYNSSSVNNNPPYLYANTITVTGAAPVVSIEFDTPSGNHGNFFAVSGNAAGANWTPIPVTSASYNVMGIVPAAIPYPVTATMDNGTNLAGGNALNTWFEQGYVPGGVSAGLPPSGSVFSSQSQPTHYYQMGNYSTNNAILIDQNHLLENITPASPAPYSALSFLTAGANISGAMTNVCIIQHADGVNETNIFLGYDWFDSSHSASIAFEANGRVSMQNRTLNNIGNSVPYLFETYFTLADTASPVTNMVVEYYSAPSSSSTTYVMAISGSAGGIQPLITSGPLPASQTLFPGQTASFTVSVTGTAPVTNSWLVEVNGSFVPLTDGLDANGSTIRGSGTENLVISNLTAADSGTYEYVAANAFGSQSGTATLTVLAPGNSLEWSANGNSGVWDTGSSANWINQANSSQSVFNAGDLVTFDDTVGVPTTVTVNGTVIPTAITVNSSTNNFTISGSGTLSGPGNLVKTGSSTLSLNVAASFTGTATIKGGTVLAGYYAFANASSITITNNSTMDFAGSTMVNDTPITVSGTGTGGEGAIFNSGYALYGQVLNIKLTGDTTFGASSRWDLGAGSQISGGHNLTIDWSAGSGYGEWNTPTIAANVAGITLTNGNIGIKYLDTSFSNPGTVFTVSPNCQMTFWNGGFNGSIHLLNNAQAIIYTAPAAFNGSSLILESNALWESYGNTGATTPVNSAIILNGIAHIVIGDHNMVYTNVISGPGGYVEDYWNHAMVLSASNTYSGPTVINDGPEVALIGIGSISHSSSVFFGGSDPTVVHIDASGRPDQTFTLTAGQTLAGVGIINGGLTVSVGALLSPAGTNITIGITNGSNPVGIITASNNITLNGSTLMKLNGSGVSDELVSGTKITYGGTLTVANVSGASLAAGNSFQLFSAPGMVGSFSSISPATPGPGLAWDLSQLNTFGTLNVISTSSPPVIGNTRLSGGNLIFSGTGGTISGTYYVLTATNLLTPLPDWVPIATNTYDASGNFVVTNAITTGAPAHFYRIKQ